MLENETEIIEPRTILQEIKHFFSVRYQRKSRISEDECDKFLEGINVTSLSEEEKVKIGDPITLPELKQVLKLNHQKSEVRWIGNFKNQPKLDLEYKWVDLTEDSMKILGVHMGYNKGLCESRNFDSVLENIVSVLHL